MLGIELISATIGKLNIIYVVTSDDNLIPRYVFNLAYLTLATGDCGWDTVVSVHARFLVFLSCAGVFCDSVGAARANSGTLLVHW